MAKNLMAMIGLAAVLAALSVWQFGFFSGKVDEVRTQIQRETAVARAERIVRDMEQRAGELTERARKLRIDARAREKAIERETSQLSRKQEAIRRLATVAQEAGLPRPTEATTEHLQQTLSFAGRSLTGQDVYRSLERWQGEVTREAERLALTRQMIDRIRTTADDLETKQGEYLTRVQNTRSTLERLEMQRDLAQLDSELAELGASAAGQPAGELREVLETLQRQIDEYEATREVLTVSTSAGDSITPHDVLAEASAEPSARDDIDALWDAPVSEDSEDQ